jgi:hypothetical protein
MFLLVQSQILFSPPSKIDADSPEVPILMYYTMIGSTTYGRREPDLRVSFTRVFEPPVTTVFDPPGLG